jgi:hypothetical protein
MPGISGDPGDTVTPQDEWKYKGQAGTPGYPGRAGDDLYLEIQDAKIVEGPKGPLGDFGMSGNPGRGGGKGALGDRVKKIITQYYKKKKCPIFRILS